MNKNTNNNKFKIIDKNNNIIIWSNKNKDIKNNKFIPNKADYKSLLGLKEDRQINILLKENEKLSNELKECIHQFGYLPNNTKGNTDQKNKNNIKLILQNDNKKLKDINSQNNKTINDLLNFINELNKKLDKNKINIYEIKKASNKDKGIEKLLRPLLDDIDSFIDEGNSKKIENEENEKREPNK